MVWTDLIHGNERERGKKKRNLMVVSSLPYKRLRLNEEKRGPDSFYSIRLQGRRGASVHFSYLKRGWTGSSTILLKKGWQ